MSDRTKARAHGPQEYKGNGNHRWESVDADSSTKRLRVPGGWLYASFEYQVNDGCWRAANMVFVPLPPVVDYAI